MVRLVAILFTAALSSATALTDISGTLLGHDSRPMASAIVMVFDRPFGRPLTAGSVAADGSFRLSVDESGILLVRFVGVYHLPETTAVFVEGQQPIRVEARLSTPLVRRDFEELTLQAKSSGASWNGRRLTRQPDGTYAVEFETPESQVSYRVRGALADEQTGGVHSRTEISGTMADSYQCPDAYRSGCFSVVNTTDGHVRISFEPSQLLQSNEPAQIRFPGDQSRNAQVSEIVSRLYRWEREQGRDWRQHYGDYEERAVDGWRNDGTVLFFDYQPDPPNAKAVSRLVSQIQRETDSVVRQVLLLEYLEKMWQTDVADPKIVAQALEEIPPDSTVWRWRSNNSWRLAGLLRKSFTLTSRHGDHLDYALTLAENFGGYGGLWNRARHEEDPGFADAVYARMRDRIPDDRLTKWITRQATIRGSSVPDFSVPSLDDPSDRFTNDHFRDKVYLIDFWATWCFPCLEAMPRLHQLYDQYRTHGFEILGYSLDSAEETVQQFRAAKWPMPWPNSIEPEKGFESDIVKAFGLEAVPYPVLVDRDGKILEAGEDFSVEELETALRQLLGKPR